MPILATAALASAATLAAFLAVWLRQLTTRNAGVIDPVWAAMLGVSAVLAATLGNGAAVNRACVGVAGGVWSARLAAHLWQRQRGRPEDVRYHQLRMRWGPAAPRRMLGSFVLQAAVSTLLSVAFLIPAYRTVPASAPRVACAAAVWLAALAGESVADRQLRRFAAAPGHADAVCRVGLWRYSRHPNYFFECLHWAAYPVLALDAGRGLLTLLPPVLIGWLLLKVSGIPLLEAHLAATRPGYRDYLRTTSALIPWPPRKPAARPVSPPSQER
jgi:steroid 5-alpha reductase family enzyme